MGTAMKEARRAWKNRIAPREISPAKRRKLRMPGKRPKRRTNIERKSDIYIRGILMQPQDCNSYCYKCRLD
jgi:hypothetical protein